jgi:hypothetical protein
MAYEGDVLNACGLFALDLREVAVVAVSGSGPNVCGHLVLYQPARGGLYFHVAGLHGYPRFMTEPNYRRYLRENRKRELKRIAMKLPDPTGAEAYVERALGRSWFWGVLPHNCVAFCEEVIRAGGGSWSSASNCPILAADVPQDLINHFLARLESAIYRGAGAARIAR